MRNRILVFLTLFLMAIAMLVACSNDSDDTITGTDQDAGDDDTNTGDDTLSIVIEDHEDPNDYVWESNAVIPIALLGDSIDVDTDAVTVEGSIATITSAGTYSLSGTLDNGQIIVDTDDEDIVRLILNGADITCSYNAPIFIKSAEKTIIVLADGTTNTVTDGDTYVFEDPEDDEPNAAIFSKDDFTIYGNGSLTVNGNYNDAIGGKDGLVINSGNLEVYAADDGIRGKDYLVVKGGSITLSASDDGLKSDDDDSTKGYIAIQGGSVDITCGGDAIEAENFLLISDGTVDITSGGGSSAVIDDSESAKGIKADTRLIIESGDFSINCADDGIHSNGYLSIRGGSFSIASGDDAIHADSDLVISDGVIDITKSYEGIESADADIFINGGTIHLVSSDDGINVAGGGDGVVSTVPYYLYINGGYVVVEASGDGIDVNGSIMMTDGVVIVNGPTVNNNGAIDYDGSFKIAGGFLVAVGSSGMAQAPGSSSTQYSVMITLPYAYQAGTLLNIQSGDGDDIVTFAPTKRYQSIVFSSPDLQSGSTYDLYFGGSSTGTVVDGLYSGGTYTPGTQYTAFTVSSIVTVIK